jgi:putative multiple sugar transport system substrate-binding protein
MSGLISSCGYGPGKISLDAVFCKNDVMARGVVQALIEAGYGEGDVPFVVGRGCDSENVDLISRGLQTMSLYDDADVLAEALNEAISDALGIEAYEPNADADNGEKTVPAFLCEPVICDAANYATLLVDK